MLVGMFGEGGRSEVYGALFIRGNVVQERSMFGRLGFILFYLVISSWLRGGLEWLL
jgi:hypothetical protein